MKGSLARSASPLYWGKMKQRGIKLLQNQLRCLSKGWSSCRPLCVKSLIYWLHLCFWTICNTCRQVRPRWAMKRPGEEVSAHKWRLLSLRTSLTQDQVEGLPWWRSGWESACQCRGHGFAPWSGKIPHAAEQLGPWATTTEPVRLEPVLRNKRGHDSERPVHRDEEWPPLAATRESPSTETKTQHSFQSINQSINQSLRKKKKTKWTTTQAVWSREFEILVLALRRSKLLSKEKMYIHTHISSSLFLLLIW